MLLVERLLHRMELAVRGEALDRRHLAAVRLHREHGARLHRLAVEQDGARAARRGVAADVRALQPELLAQEVHEQLPRLDVRLAPLAVDRQRDVRHAFASWSAFHTFSPLQGRSTCRTPWGASASSTAFGTACVEPTVPDSPIPFTPITLLRSRGHHLDPLVRGQLGRRRERVPDEGARQRIAVLAVHDLLVERLPDPEGDAAVHLPVRDERVDQRPRVVDRDVPCELDLAGLGVDLDDREVRAERERRRCLELVRDLQLAEPPVR